ncbi:MAG: conjugal transfer protein TraF [Rhodocyclaceae bacterium]|nr:conjugal transfer protein TraF [Rhodocyclaceae bacterium]
MLGGLVAALGAMLLLVGQDAGAGAAMDYPSAWACNQAKFNWYCDLEAEEAPQEPKTAPKPRTEQQQALDELERLAKDLKEKRALAIVEPTPVHVHAYIAAQEAVMEKGSVFSDVWRRVVWQNPDINYQLKNPVNNAAVQVRDSERRKLEAQTLADLGKEWGLFFFFRSDCPYCHSMSQIMKLMSDLYGITVFPISLDGGGLPEFPQPQKDNGMATLLNVEKVPMVVLGNVKDRRMVPIGSGVLSAQEIIERIYVLTRTKPGDLY